MELRGRLRSQMKFGNEGMGRMGRMGRMGLGSERLRGCGEDQAWILKQGLRLRAAGQRVARINARIAMVAETR